MMQNSLDEEYLDFLERRERQETGFFKIVKDIPKKPLIFLGIAAVLLVLLWAKGLTEQTKMFIIFGTIIGIIILLTLSRKDEALDYISEGEAIKILKEYLIRKREEIPAMDKCELDPQPETQLQFYDFGDGGMRPWRWLVSWDLVKGFRRTRYVTYIDPYFAKIIGTELLSTQFKGKLEKNLKIIYPIEAKAAYMFKRDMIQGRTKW